MNTVSCFELSIFIRKRCIFSCVDECVLITCYSQKDYVFLVQHRKNIKEAIAFIFKAPFFHVEQVTIGIQGTETRQTISFKMLEQPVQIILPTTDLIQECLSYEGACGIVRMDDHKGLFSNELITFSSNAHPNDWVGEDMSKYWFEEELKNYLERLNKDRELRNYSYVAKMMNGQIARLTVDARIINWRGEEARIVKNISRELLS